MNIFNDKLKAVTTYATPKGLFPALPTAKTLALQPLKTVNNILGHQLSHGTTNSSHLLQW